MDVSFIAVVMILAIIAIAIVIYKSIAEKDTSPTDDTGGGKLHISSGEKTRSGTPYTSGREMKRAEDNNENHSLERISVCVYPTGMWVCPICECENDLGSRYCCVCNKQR